jgi:predicted phosphodiesterase
MRSLALSDLHLGRTSSRLRRPEALLPILHGFDRILLLGDVIDDWYVTHAQEQELSGRLREVCRKAGARQVVWFRGNHDANRPDGEEYALLDGVLYLHGHAVYNPLNGHGTLKERIRALNADRFGPERKASRLNKRTWEFVEYAYKRFPHVLLVPILWRSSVQRRMKALAEELRHEGPVHAMVLGHSHSPGARHLKGLHVFNLGGWMSNTRPYGFIFENGWGRLTRIETHGGEPSWGGLWREALLNGTHVSEHRIPKAETGKTTA